MKKIVFTVAGLLSITGVFCQLPDSLRNHLDSAIGILQTHSLYAKKVNWPAARKQAYAAAAGATSREQLFQPIAGVYKKLDDHHGWFEQYNDKIQLTDSSTAKRLTENIKKAWAKGPKIVAEMMGDVAYLRMPGMPAYKRTQIEFYANWLADSINSLAAKKPAGWIIDLRMNTGGNILPMMTALACFFDDGVVSYYLDRNNKPSETSLIKNRIFYQDTLHIALAHAAPDLRTAKVAVLIGPGTASSGEGLAANFKQRPNTRLFGTKTAGVANSTEGFVFNNDNTYFLITTAQLGDKNRKPLPAFVLPHVEQPHNDLFDNLPNDNAVWVALKWLR